MVTTQWFWITDFYWPIVESEHLLKINFPKQNCHKLPRGLIGGQNLKLVSELIGWIPITKKLSHEKDEGVNPAWWLHKLSVPWPRTYDQKWWCYLSSQWKNIMSEPFPKHAAFLSRYFNHELCTKNAGLDARDALHKNMSDGILKLLRTWISCGCCASSGCKGPGTQRHKMSFSWISCN